MIQSIIDQSSGSSRSIATRSRTEMAFREAIACEMSSLGSSTIISIQCIQFGGPTSRSHLESGQESRCARFLVATLVTACC